MQPALREGGGRERALPAGPDRPIRLGAGSDVTGQIGVPVRLVFLVPQPDGTVVANYPSPLGVTRAQEPP
jgi:hypothetical protein